jgi:XTP/dITP diphosphohydrolase
MNNLIFATNNKNKVIEIRSLLPGNFAIKSLSEAGIHIDIPEPHNTLEENAIEKAEVIYKLTNTTCFAEDTGLEVNTMNGEPGVRSARYAGDEKSFENNIDKLLKELNELNDRSARFRTVICLKYKEKHNIFEGECKGYISSERLGNSGFGYDSIFVPEGSLKTFAQMSLKEKNFFSHRRKAMDKLIAFLKMKEMGNVIF